MNKRYEIKLRGKWMDGDYVLIYYIVQITRPFWLLWLKEKETAIIEFSDSEQALKHFIYLTNLET